MQALTLVLALAAVAPAEDKNDTGFTPMFNGRDLTGWVNVNCAPGTFFVKGGEIITTGKPTGYLRTPKQYENFVAEFEWMHVNKTEVGNSGFFVWADPLPAIGTPYTRGIEVQVLVNLEKEGYYTSQGDLFSIHGATCKPDRPHPQGWARCLPSERRCKGGGEWNHYKVVANDGVIKLHVNGKEVSGVSQCRPRKGYLALESEGAECHFRNVKIKELPSTNPKPEEIADVAKGFKNLYTGLDLSGWQVDSAGKGRWQPRDSVLHCDAPSARLQTEAGFGDGELIMDFRFPPKKGETPALCGLLFKGGMDQSVGLTIAPDGTIKVGRNRLSLSAESKAIKPAGQWNRLHILSGKSLQVAVNGTAVTGITGVALPEKWTLALTPQGEMDFCNLFVRELKAAK